VELFTFELANFGVSGIFNTRVILQRRFGFGAELCDLAKYCAISQYMQDIGELFVADLEVCAGVCSITICKYVLNPPDIMWISHLTQDS